MRLRVDNGQYWDEDEIYVISSTDNNAAQVSRIALFLASTPAFTASNASAPRPSNAAVADGTPSRGNFVVLVQIGRAAENANDPKSPYYRTVSGRAVNWYWYQAARLANRKPSLMADITAPELYAAVDGLLESIRSGALPADAR